jgi:hypothetical protein
MCFPVNGSTNTDYSKKTDKPQGPVKETQATVVTKTPETPSDKKEETLLVANSGKLGKAAKSVVILEPVKNYDISTIKTAATMGNIALQPLFNSKGPIVPAHHTVGGYFLTIGDFMDADEKSKDPGVSQISKALAWTSVGVDVIGLASKYLPAVYGIPVGWAADAMSLATTALSDRTVKEK